MFWFHSKAVDQADVHNPSATACANMGKLNIAHHKSYHPYRRDNIERVRKDEEEAAQKEAEQEGRIALADAEARLALLRERAGIGGKGKERASEVEDSANAVLGPGSGTGIGSGRHINLFEDLEQVSIACISYRVSC